MKLQFTDGSTLDVARVAVGRTRYDGGSRDALIIDVPLAGNDMGAVYAQCSEDNCALIAQVENGQVMTLYPDYCIRAMFQVVTEEDEYTGVDASFIRVTLARLTYLEKKLR